MFDAIAIHEAYKRGDLEALKAALGNPPDFPEPMRDIMWKRYTE